MERLTRCFGAFVNDGRRAAPVLGLVLLVGIPVLSGSALAAAPAGGEPAVRTEVKREEAAAPKHSSLRFLRDNRVFIRGQLDRLRLLTTLTREGEAELLDERLLGLQELAAAIAAARDTVAVETATTARRELLDSVARLTELDSQLALMENLAAEQKTRLQILESDFLGQQETALVILVRGLPENQAPGGIVLSENNEILNVPLTATQQTALRQGGVAQVYHRFVEPRDHIYSVSFSGADWVGVPPVEIPVTAARDRITFVELDLSHLGPAAPTTGLLAKVWQR
ncbi:MAG: hypothetical protein GY838_13880 [bacterium]|nr:hypothetical protein [bacterium]